MQNFEKIATRSWKKNYGSLSESTKQKLVDTGILNRRREIDGLNKGSYNIVKKLGGTVDSSKDHRLIQKLVANDNAGKVTANYAKSYTKSHADSMHGFLTHNTGKVVSRGDIMQKVPLKSKIYNVYSDTKERKKHGENILSAAKKSVKSEKSLKKQFDIIKDSLKTKTDRDHANAVMFRHEADELREGMKHLKGGKHTAKNISLSSHNGPGVLQRESANVALMNPRMRSAFQRQRKNVGDLKLMNKVAPGFKYGENATINKKEMTNAAKRNVLRNKAKGGK